MFSIGDVDAAAVGNFHPATASERPTMRRESYTYSAASQVQSNAPARRPYVSWGECAYPSEPCSTTLLFQPLCHRPYRLVCTSERGTAALLPPSLSLRFLLNPSAISCNRKRAKDRVDRASWEGEEPLPTEPPTSFFTPRSPRPRFLTPF